MRLLVLLFTLLLSACAMTSMNDNYTQTVSSWRWAKGSSLLQSWGRPSQIESLPNGNKVYIYRKEAYKNYPPPPVTSNFATVAVAGGKSFIVVPTSQLPQPGPAYLLECTTLFELDPHNIIVDVRARGNHCAGDESFALSRSNPHPLGQAQAKKASNS